MAREAGEAAGAGGAGPSWPAHGSPSTNVCPAELNKVYCVHLSYAEQEKSLSSLKHFKK